MRLAQNKKGFTLIELLVVIAIIATLAVVVFVALNPVRRFRESRNSTRGTEINQILTAIHASIVDDDGALPTSLVQDDLVYMVGTCGAGGLAADYECNGSTLEADCVALGADLTEYLASMPIDPSGAGKVNSLGVATPYSAAATGYAVEVSTSGLISVYACGSEDPDGSGPELAPVLVVSR